MSSSFCWRNEANGDCLHRFVGSASQLLASLSVIEVTRPILSRAAQPFATALGTLDAIHLSSALLWRDQIGGDVVLVTHDAALARAAQSSGLGVAG